MPQVKPPYLGAAYYPEDWPLEQIGEDIRLMKDAGLNLMRIGEFAWSRMEPEEGKFDLAWLHLVVEKLGKAGIGVVMCTPTCTPPAWLVTRHPEVLLIDSRGVQRQHGARRHACPLNPVYRDYCKRIVTRLAEDFGHYEQVIGWQIDNELYPGSLSSKDNRGCCCPVCIDHYHTWLKERYPTIGDLNKAWGTDLWSQTYNDFSQIPYPHADTWHHPSLLTTWMECQSDSYIDFCESQATILHRLTKHPVGTDMMPFGGLNYYKMHRNLDVVQFNHYNDVGNLWMAAFWLDFMRPIKETPYWVTETSTCWPGSVFSQGYREEGFCRVNSWLAYALGGETNMYWLWRTHWSGQELMHGAVVSSCGRPMYTYGEVQEIASGLDKCKDFLNDTRPTRSGLALHLSGYAWWLFQFQSQVRDFNYGMGLQELYYHPLFKVNQRPDIIDPAADLSPYKVVCSPFLPSLDECNIRDRLEEWIKAGGTWIAGPFTDIRNCHAAKYIHAPFSVLEDWADIKCKYQLPGVPRDFKLRYYDGTESTGRLWYDGFETGKADVLATYTEGPLKGLAAITQRSLGQGKIIVLGTLPQPAELQRLVISVCDEAGMDSTVTASSNVLAVTRQGSGGKGMIVLEMENKPGRVQVLQPMTDLLQGTSVQGLVSLDPLTVMVLKE